MIAHARPLVLLALPLLVTAGCVTTEEGSVVLGNPYATANFQGFASAPGATIKLKALNKSTDGWELVTTTTASTGPVNFGGETMYSWSISAQLIEPGNATHLCRLSESCTLQESDVYVQFDEVGGEFSPLMTFDNGGVDCTIDEVNAGADLATAAWNCRGAVFDRIAIPVLL